VLQGIAKSCRIQCGTAKTKCKESSAASHRHPHAKGNKKKGKATQAAKHSQRDMAPHCIDLKFEDSVRHSKDDT